MSNLQTILRLNALSCLGFGLAFALWPAPIATFLGAVSPGILRWVGIALACNGLHLIVASRKTPKPWELRYFVLGDSLWVVGSIILVLVPGIIQGAAAITAVGLVAAMVGSFAGLQVYFGKDLNLRTKRAS